MNYLLLLNKFHSKLIFGRRVRAIAQSINQVLPKDVKTIVDVGCGDGSISFLVKKKHNTLSIMGLEILKRKRCFIKYKIYDGKSIPFESKSFDLALLVDVFHHSDNIDALFKESTRVSKKYILIKDHIFNSRLDTNILRIMDWIGNKGYGVDLIYNYKKRAYWMNLFRKNGMSVVSWVEDISLYPFPIDLIFGRKLHFIALIKR